MNKVSFGGGINSTAMIIEMHKRKMPIDLIIFADTGVEHPHTYEHIKEFDGWLRENDLPPITLVWKTDKDGNLMDLESYCLHYKNLPSIAYGWKKCSLSFKKAPQDKFCNNNPDCKKVWAEGNKIDCYIGYDAGEPERAERAFAINLQDKKYKYHYPLIDWNIDREKCIEIVQKEGLEVPKKSSCFFCPSMKKKEILELKKYYPNLYERAIAIEDNAQEGLITVKGLGRNWSWKSFVEAEESQMSLCAIFQENEIPCDCYDGY